MQAGRGRGHRAGGLRENGLVTLAVAGQFAVALEVGRQRQFAQFIKLLKKIFTAGKLQPPVAFGINVGDGRDNFCRRAGFLLQSDFSPDLRAFAGSNHRPPVVHAVFFEQQNFKSSSGF